MLYYTHTLSNGLRLIHVPTDSPVSYCGYGIQAGSRDEETHEQGLAHFTEHMIFKGTEKRKAWHILNRMENVGGELNAYTTKEDTFVYSIFMEQHVKRAIELLTDLVFHSQFPAHELEKEKEVVLDEINSYKDNPSELIFDEFDNILFNGHALGHNILGDEKTVSRFNTKKGLSFTGRYYHPGNMVFFSMGRTSFPSLCRMVEKMAGGIPSSATHHSRTAPELIPAAFKRVEMDTHQTHVLIGGRTYNMYDEKRIRIFLLNNILGGPGMNSRLNVSLREKHGLAYNVESSITSYTDTGAISIYFGTDPRHLDKAIRLVHQELKKVRDQKLTTSQLAAVKKQLTGQLGVSGDNKESVFLGMGKSFLHHNRYDSLSEIFAKIESVTAEQLLETANDTFSPEKLSCLIYE